MAKAFYTNGTGSQQTLSEIESEVIPSYKTQAEADADLNNLEENQIIATEEDEAVENGTQYPANVVEKNNMHAVTSNAVAKSLSYSTTEQKTGGTWIDGKPIYRKVFTGSVTGATTTINSDVANIDNMINLTGYFVTSDSDRFFPLNYCADPTTNRGACNFIKNLNQFLVYIGSGYPSGGSSIYIIAEYTKTTD